MQKRFFFIFLITIIISSNFYCESFSKKGKTYDGYSFDVTGTIEEDGTFKYVKLDSFDTEELFVWEFDKFNEAMEHFNWLKENNFKFVEQKRPNWREYSYKATVSNEFIIYYISKKQRLNNKNFDWNAHEWRR